jgi:type IV pilus assembly protein PilB
MARVRIGELLVQRGRIDELQLQSALAHQRRWGGRLGRAVVTLGFLSEPSFLETLGEQLGAPFVTIGDRPVERDVLRLLPEKLVRSRGVLPLARVREGKRGALVVAVSDPGDLGVLDELTFATGLDVKPVLASEADLGRAIRRLLGAATPPLHAVEPIDLPEDTSPLTLLRRRQKGSLH